MLLAVTDAVLTADDLVDTKGAAELLNRSVPTVNRWVAEGRLKAFYEHDRHRLYRRADVLALAVENTGPSGT